MRDSGVLNMLSSPSYIGSLSLILGVHPQQILQWEMKRIRSFGKSIFKSMLTAAYKSRKSESDFSDMFCNVNYIEFKKNIENDLGVELSAFMLKYIRGDRTGGVRRSDQVALNKNNIAKRFVRFIKKLQLNVEMNSKGIKYYVGDSTHKFRVQQNEINQEFLAKQFFRTEKGKLRPISEIADRAVQMRSEIYLEMKAADDICQKHGMTWMMVTITLPGQFHSNPRAGKNSWQLGTEIDDCLDFFRLRWNNMRKFISKKKNSHLKFSEKTGFGFKIIEPHLDGTPHWHIMLYCDPHLIQEYKNLFTRYFKTSEKSINFNVEDKMLPNRASGASYLFKYVIKYNESDLEQMSRIDAWRSAVGVRCFDRIGFRGEKTLYRNLRKISSKLQNTGTVEFIRKEGVSDDEFNVAMNEITSLMNIATRKKINNGNVVNDICYAEFIWNSQRTEKVVKAVHDDRRYDIYENSMIKILVRKTIVTSNFQEDDNKIKPLLNAIVFSGKTRLSCSKKVFNLSHMIDQCERVISQMKMQLLETLKATDRFMYYLF